MKSLVHSYRHHGRDQAGSNLVHHVQEAPGHEVPSREPQDPQQGMPPSTPAGTTDGMFESSGLPAVSAPQHEERAAKRGGGPVSATQGRASCGIGPRPLRDLEEGWPRSVPRSNLGPTPSGAVPALYDHHRNHRPRDEKGTDPCREWAATSSAALHCEANRGGATTGIAFREQRCAPNSSASYC